MRQIATLLLLLIACAASAGADEPTGSKPLHLSPSASQRAAGKVSIYTPGADATVPELLPVPNTSLAETKCKGKDKVEGSPALSLIVGPDGLPHNIHFLRPTSNDLDLLALRILSADRFKPGTHAGSPAAVAVSMEIHLESCAIFTTHENGDKTAALDLIAQPAQVLADPEDAPAQAVLVTGPVYSELDSQANLGTASAPGTKGTVVNLAPDMTPPKIINNHVEAHYSAEGRKAKINGTVLLGLVVDAQGMPQHITVLKKLGHGLDEQAISAVHLYRLLPAIQDGKPVPVPIAIEVRFRLY